MLIQKALPRVMISREHVHELARAARFVWVYVEWEDFLKLLCGTPLGPVLSRTISETHLVFRASDPMDLKVITQVVAGLREDKDLLMSFLYEKFKFRKPSDPVCPGEAREIAERFLATELFKWRVRFVEIRGHPDVPNEYRVIFDAVSPEGQEEGETVVLVERQTGSASFE